MRGVLLFGYYDKHDMQKFFVIESYKKTKIQLLQCA